MTANKAIGILGGTGELGRGLATRLATGGWRVVLGSRDGDRARVAADLIGQQVRGATNEEAAGQDLVMVAVPWKGHAELLRSLEPHLRERLVIDCVNPLGFDERGPFAIDVPEGSAMEQAQSLLPRSRVVGAFHHVAAETLLSSEPLSGDVLVVGDERDAVETVISLVDSIAGLRGVYGGRLRNARQVEALTANLIAINRRYRTRAGITITGV